ncbi:MAG TPA: hypothetical protein VH601_21060 [Bryobacteraceae bacterium]|jgi:hypothetical protein
MTLALILYAVLFAIVLFAPLRWSLIAYLVLSTIDLGSMDAGIGVLNTAKAVLLPVYLLWRLRDYAGHGRIILAPIAWSLLTVYAAVAAAWSFYPMFAIKLVGHMIALFLICIVFMRATKSGHLTPAVVLPVAAGALILAALRSIFAPAFGGEAERFKSFSSAQSFAAFLVALYAIALCSKSPRLGVRLPLCGILIAALVFDGSRLWMLGLVLSTLVALLLSSAAPWIKVCTVGISAVVATVTIAESDVVLTFLARQAPSNRIAAAIIAGYRGDSKSYGLGTYRLRRELDVRAVTAIGSSGIRELTCGRGTSNSAELAGGLARKPDPNRIMHNEWLRVAYEWGITGMILWLMFFGSIALYALQGLRKDEGGYSKPLLIYLPAFALGLAGENIIAGAGNDVSAGFLLVIALASISHRVTSQFRNVTPEQHMTHVAA